VPRSAKTRHEVRDGLHGFIEFDSLEKRLIDSEPFQRLRSIHQLAMCYQVYPGATHKRFEHSLGVMDVATRIFETVLERRVRDEVRDRIAEELENEQLKYWKRVVRLAALLHDIGHLPFSHAAESALLPSGWDHERITADIILHSEIASILQEARPPIEPNDVVDVAWDIEKRVKHDPELALSPWKTLLNEILTGNTFGADRIDYLLRDSWHAGVAYGRFDPDRLIGGLRVVIDPDNDEVALGLDIGSIHAAEALLLARYFMYTQVYFHDVRRVYDLHLKDFLHAWLPGGKFPSDWRSLVRVTDNEVLSALWKAAGEPSHDLHDLACRVVKRQHYRTVYELVSLHKRRYPTVFQEALDVVRAECGAGHVRFDSYGPKSETNDFLVLTEDGTIGSSLQESGVIANIPPFEIGLVFASPEMAEKATRRVKSFLGDHLSTPKL
jgi:uncharacterized protein